MGQLPTTALPFIALLLKELFIGVSLAFIVNLIFEAARVAGTLTDTMAGSNNAQLYVPQLGQQVSLFSSLKVQLAVVLFLTLNGHHIVIEALADSLVAIPLDRFPQFSQGAWPFFDLMIRVFADLLAISLALAAPTMLATFLTDLALGAINRVAPQIQVFFISMAIKPLVAVLICLDGAVPADEALPDRVHHHARRLQGRAAVPLLSRGSPCPIAARRQKNPHKRSSTTHARRVRSGRART